MSFFNVLLKEESSRTSHNKEDSCQTCCIGSAAGLLNRWVHPPVRLQHHSTTMCFGKRPLKGYVPGLETLAGEW